MTLKAELEMNDSFEHQTEDVALNAKLNMRLWTPELKSDGSSERQNWETMMALNGENKKWWWLWTSKLRNDDGSKHLNWKQTMALNAKLKKVVALMLKWKCGSKCQTEDAALNAKIKMWLSTSKKNKDLDVKMKMWLWTLNEKWTTTLNAKWKKVVALMSKWKCSSERQNKERWCHQMPKWKYGFERQTESDIMTLNVELGTWL